MNAEIIETKLTVGHDKELYVCLNTETKAVWLKMTGYYFPDYQDDGNWAELETDALDSSQLSAIMSLLALSR